MKKPLPPAAIAVAAVLLIAVVGFIAYRTFGTQGLSPEEQRVEKIMIERSNAESARMHEAGGGSAMSADEAKARGATAGGSP